MKVTIFGGGGFIGSAIVDQLLLEGHELRIFERPNVVPYRQFSSGEPVEWLPGDLSSLNDIKKAVEGANAVIHLISTTLPKSSNDNPIYDVESNIVSSLQILDAMVSNGVKRIVFISSGGTIYGPPLYLPVDENHPTDPIVSYGVTKLAIEKYLYIFERMHGMKSISLRVANPYGERQRIQTAQGAVGAFLHRALQRKPIEIWGDGSVVRDYVHVHDVARAFGKALTYSGQQRLFNISSGVGVSLNQLILELEAVLGHPIEKHYRPGRSFDVPVNILDNQLAALELGWLPLIPLADGISRTAKWMRQTSIAS